MEKSISFHLFLSPERETERERERDRVTEMKEKT